MGETLVTVEFEARGDATEVVLLHTGFPAVEAKEAHMSRAGARASRTSRRSFSPRSSCAASCAKSLCPGSTQHPRGVSQSYLQVRPSCHFPSARNV